MVRTQDRSFGVDEPANLKSFLAMMPRGQAAQASGHGTTGDPKATTKNPTAETAQTSQGRKHTVSDNNMSSAKAPLVEAVSASQKGENTIAGDRKPSTKHPAVEAVQAQDSSSLVGVHAPPSTPEDVTNNPIGKMLMEEIQKIPPERFLTLADSIHATPGSTRGSPSRFPPDSQLRSKEDFINAIPSLIRNPDHPGFDRISSQAADSSAPKTFDLPIRLSPKKHADNTNYSLNKPPPELPLHLKQAVAGAKENVKPVKSSNTNVSNSHSPVKIIKPAYSTLEQLAKAVAFDEETAKASKVLTPNTPDSPLLYARKPVATTSSAKKADTSKVFTPDTPDSPLLHGVKPAVSGASIEKRNIAEAFASDTMGMPPGLLSPLKPVIATASKETTTQKTPRSSSSSTTFEVDTPTKVRPAGSKGKVPQGKVVGGGNLEAPLYFNAWPSQGGVKSEDGRVRSAAQIRQVFLTGLPLGFTASLVSSLVFCGPLEHIHVGNSTAFVRFLRAEDAAKYYNSTDNGLVYEKDGKKHIIMTEMGKEVSPVSGLLREWTEREFTRCVRAIGVDKEYSFSTLQQMAAAKGRNVEKIIDGFNLNNMRSVTFRFCEISHAVQFKQTLNRNEDWEMCNIHFAPDPCTSATGIHED